MKDNPYKLLAERLNSLPNGFPPTPNGTELRLLAKLFSPEEAAIAAKLRLTPHSPKDIAQELIQGMGTPIEIDTLQNQLKGMARKGLINVHKKPEGLTFSLIPFVVGIYELQVGSMDAELAQLFEEYYLQAFKETLSVQPTFHRVLPVNESIRMNMEVHPYESVSEIVMGASSWGVLDCICRKQKALIGQACGHPIDVCMAISKRANVFDHSPIINAMTQQEAMDTLKRAARAGLVHSVSNYQEDITYICNCCTCSCGILRGMAELGVANVVAKSAFTNQVDSDLCMGCEDCLTACQFAALSISDGCAVVDMFRCVGCGVCVPQCPEGALGLIRRPEGEIQPIPQTIIDWGMQRAESRQIDLSQIL